MDIRGKLPGLDGALHDALSKAIAGDGRPAVPLDAVGEVAGGSISRALLVSSRGDRWFVKLNDASLADLFAAEADGLAALAACAALRVPRPVAHGVAGRHAYLVLEHLHLQPLREHAHAASAGRALVELHRLHGKQFGWRRHNHIGSSRQDNTPHGDWPVFFARRRLLPQFELARHNGYAGKLLRDGERLLDSMAALFIDHQPCASLLHGDLWSGNAALDEAGTLALFDPAVHYGDREADLAMTALFGGFPAGFYAAYREAWPLDAGFEQRKTLYNLYHVLNHLNLFGRGYLQQAERMTASLLAEVGAG